MAQRLKGQEVEVLLVVNGVPKTTITSIKDFEVEAQLEVMSEGYLGETTDRKDSIFKGMRFKMTINPDTQDVLKVLQQFVDKARRRTPGVKINIKATLNFPNGQRPRVILPDVEIGAFPLTLGGRSEYAAVTLQGEASEFSVLY